MLSIGRYSSQFLSVLLIPVFIGSLSKNEFVGYSIYISLAAILILIYDFSTSVVGVSKIAKNRYSVRRLAKQVLYYRGSIFGTTLIFSGAMGVMSADYLWLAGALAIGMQAFRPIWIYHGFGQLKYIVMVELVSKSCQFFLVINSDSLNLSRVILIILICEVGNCFAQNLPLIRFWFRVCKVKGSFKRLVGDFIFEGRAVFTGKFYGVIYTNITAPFGSLIWGAAGIYEVSVIERVLRGVSTLLAPFAQAALPILSKGWVNRKRQILSIQRFMIGIGFVISVSLIIAMQFSANLDVRLQPIGEIGMLGMSILGLFPIILSYNITFMFLQFSASEQYERFENITLLGLRTYIVAFVSIFMLDAVQLLPLLLLVPELAIAFKTSRAKI